MNSFQWPSTVNCNYRTLHIHGLNWNNPKVSMTWSIYIKQEYWIRRLNFSASLNYFTNVTLLFRLYCSASLQSSKWCSLFSVTLSSYPPVRTTKKYCINRDCSMESGHKQLLFTSCDTSKVQTSDHSKNKWIFDASQLKTRGWLLCRLVNIDKNVSAVKLLFTRTPSAMPEMEKEQSYLLTLPLHVHDMMHTNHKQPIFHIWTLFLP